MPKTARSPARKATAYYRGASARDQWLSLGYDRIRLVAPVFIGDTVTTAYEVVATEPERRRATAKITVTNQHGETVAVADHIMKLL